MQRMVNELHDLQKRAGALGFAGLWVTDASPFEAWARARQAHGDGGYIMSIQADPRAIMPTARRIVVLA